MYNDDETKILFPETEENPFENGAVTDDEPKGCVIATKHRASKDK